MFYILYFLYIRFLDEKVFRSSRTDFLVENVRMIHLGLKCRFKNLKTNYQNYFLKNSVV